MDISKNFRIRLLDAMEGLNFIDKAISAFNGKDSLSIKPFLEDLLPLATLMDERGDKPVQDMSLSNCGALFKNPLAILELGVEILKFQQVFMKDSAIFQPLISKLENTFNTKISE